jgi:hypothetical protein
MARLIGSHLEGDDVRVSWFDDGDHIAIRYSQDVQPVLDRVAAINADGGALALDGLGTPKYEFPITLIQEHAIERGIPWEKIAYSNEHDDEWPRMALKWARLTIGQKRKYL